MKISEKVKTFVMAGVLALVGIGAVIAPNAYADASDCTCTIDDNGNVTYHSCTETEKGIALAAGCPTESQTIEGMVQKIINVILYIVGILAVVMVIFGGVQYTTSVGDQAKVTKAKNTILYGLIGLVVAILAYAIVTFVVDKISVQ